MTNIDKALEILRLTEDGNRIAPDELKLLELAVNGYLNERGQAAFDELYTTVQEGTYKYPWHLGVEHMTFDHDGFVYFKGQNMEHFSRPWAYSLDAKRDLQRLQQYGLFLESRGEAVGAWPWSACDWKYQGKYAEEFAQQQRAALDNLTQNGQAVLFSQVRVWRDDDIHEDFLLPGHPDSDGVRASDEYQDLILYEKIDMNSAIEMYTYVYGDGRWVHATPEQLAAIDTVFDYLKEKELAVMVSEDRYEPILEDEDEMEL